MDSIRLINCKRTWITFDDAIYEITRRRQRARIAIDDNNCVIIGLKDQQVPFKANILGSIVPVEQERRGKIDYTKHLSLHWGDDQAVPELYFTVRPQEVAREYDRGQYIELGIEDVTLYRVLYRDGVEASFKR